MGHKYFIIMKPIACSKLFALMFLTVFTACKKEVSDPFEKDSGVFTDARDQEKYKWVRIGEQIWMAENLAYDAGDNCWVYNNDEINVVTMGRLYTWEAARDVCPDGCLSRWMASANRYRMGGNGLSGEPRERALQQGGRRR